MKLTEKLQVRLGGFYQKLGRFRYSVLLLLLGVVLLLVPGRKAGVFPSSESVATETEGVLPAAWSLQEEEARIAALLSQIRGAGSVRVMLSLKAGERTVYQADIDSQRTHDDASDLQRQSSNTVLVSKSGSLEEPLVQQVIAPVYLGAVVVCQGAEDPAVRLALVQAIASLTGLASNQITIVRMK